MQLILRLLIWLLAVSFAASPVLWTVAKSPAHQNDLFAIASYIAYACDVAFVIVIAIGLVDAFQVSASFFGARVTAEFGG